MVQTFHSGAALVTNINQDQRVVDMAGEIPYKAPRISPFLFCGMKPTIQYGNNEQGARSVSFNVRTVFNTEFKWLENELREFTTAINFAAGYLSTDVWFVVDNINIFQIGDLVLHVSSGEVIRVDELDTSNNKFKGTRSFGTTAAAALSDNDVLQIIGNVSAENSRSRASNDIVPTTKTSYIQTSETTFDGSKKSQQVELYGIKDYRLYKRGTKYVEHLYNIESSLIFGEPNGSGTEYNGTAQELSTGGMLYWATENNYDVGGALTKADFEDWLGDLFEYGSDEKFLFCGKRVSKAISKFAGDNTSQPVSSVFVQNLAKEFGVKIRTYHSDNGIVHIIRHGMLTGDVYGGYGIGVDPKHIKICRLRNGDWMKLYTDIQENDRKGWKDQYLTDFGLQVELPAYHGVLTGVDG
jgi:hypothetical protein